MEENYTNIKERLLYFAKNQSIGIENLLKNIGMTYGSFKGKAKKGSLNSNAIEEIYTKYPYLSLEWLLTGKGEMVKAGTEDSIVEKGAIPLIPIDAMAGWGSGDVRVMDYDTNHYIVPEFEELKVDFMIRVRGNSMYPKFSSGNIVACVKLESPTFFQWNKTYVLDTSQGAMIKRVKQSEKENHILCVSDNKDYEPFDITLDEVHSLALVVGVIGLE